MKTMIRLFFCILLCLMPVLSFAQGKVTRPNHNRNSQGSSPKKESVQEPTIGTLNGHDWVDLGLPSGTRWATCNVGASAIQDCGYYLSWGGQYIPKDEIYSRQNAPLFGKNVGDISGNISYDAARSKWGGQWRMPTKSEFLELAQYCEGKIGMVNGVKGCIITGPNGNSIFIPYNSVKSGGIKFDSAISVTIWLSTQSDSEMAYLLSFDDEGFHTSSCNNKNVGYPIRPVLSK